MLPLGDGIQDGLAARFHQIANLECGAPRLDVDFQIEMSEDRVMHLLVGCSEDLEHGRAGLGILAAHDAQERLPLRWGRALVNNRDNLAMALVNGARPGENAAEFQAVEFCLAVIAFVDRDPDDGLAVSMRRQGVKLARAAIGAIAMRKIPSFDSPFGR